MKVAVAGEIPLVTEIGTLCLEAGHETHLFVAEDFDDALASGRIMEEAGDAALVIEVQNDSIEAKRILLEGIGKIVAHDALILSSALATSATEAASWITNARRVAGFSLLPPVGEGGSVELAAAMQTEEATLVAAQRFWREVGLSPVVVGDGPGLVRARIVCCLINEAASALFEGVAPAEDIDTAMRLGTNYPRGPLAWADLIGIDTVLGVMNGLFREWGEDRYRPSPLLRRMVLAGKLGLKSGEGFYRYEGPNEGTDDR